MPLPVIAITNASTCLTDSQVEAVLPALQKQVSDDFKAVRQTDLRDLAHRRVRLFGRARHHLQTDAATIRRPLQSGRLGLILQFIASTADELVDGRHRK